MRSLVFLLSFIALSFCFGIVEAFATDFHFFVKLLTYLGWTLNEIMVTILPFLFSSLFALIYAGIIFVLFYILVLDSGTPLVKRA